MAKKVPKMVTDDAEVYLILRRGWIDLESPEIAYKPPFKPPDDVTLILDLIAGGASHCGHKPHKDNATDK